MQILKGKQGEYELVRCLGKGGNGEVWQAKGPTNDVAVKLLKKSGAPGDAVGRFVREVQALQRLRGVEGVLPLLDTGTDISILPRPWFVMPIAVTLSKKLEDATVRETCEAIGGIARALASVHGIGIAHRDIKPDNLYWHQGQWCLGDFGLAEVPDTEALTQSDKKLGPMYYIAPEMLNDPTKSNGQRADIYSLGKTLWVLITGQRYPLPGPHIPSYSGMSIGKYRSDRRAFAIDELLRQMTEFDPERRPDAATVACELTILAKEDIVNAAPDPKSAIAALQSALKPHFARKGFQQAKEELANAAMGRVESAIRDLVVTISEQTGLEANEFYSPPQYWGYSEHLSGPSIDWQDDRGYSFEAGGKIHTWQLGIAVRFQLLSNDQLCMFVGYELDCLVNGKNANCSGMQRGWQGEASAPNGLPSCSEAVEQLIEELKRNFPANTELFAKLVAEAVQDE